MHLFIAALWLLRSLPHGADVHGHFPSDITLSADQQKWVTAAKQWTMALWGGGGLSRKITLRPSPARWNIQNIQERTISLDLPPRHPGVDVVGVDINVTDAEGELLSGTLHIGYDFISEGVAYEVEREIRRNNNPAMFDLDSGTPLYPYLAYRQIVDHFVGRPTTARERIDLGAYALLTTSPAAELKQMCERLGRESPQPEPNDRVPEAVSAPLVEVFERDAMKHIHETLEPELQQLGQAGVIRNGVDQMLALFQAGFALRTINPVLEHNFTGRPLSAKGLKEVLAGLPDACVLQEKSGGLRELRWVGPGIVGTDADEAASMGAVQAAMHFAQQHFLRFDDRLTATSDLKQTPCPYSGACVVERNEGNPTESKHVHGTDRGRRLPVSPCAGTRAESERSPRLPNRRFRARLGRRFRACSNGPFCWRSFARVSGRAGSYCDAMTQRVLATRTTEDRRPGPTLATTTSCRVRLLEFLSACLLLLIVLAA